MLMELPVSGSAGTDPSHSRAGCSDTEAPFPLALILFSSSLVLDQVGYQWGTPGPCSLAVGYSL